MKISNTFLRINHCKFRSIFISSLNFQLDFFLLNFRQFLDFGINITNTIVHINSKIIKNRIIFFKHIFIINRNGMTKKDRI